jgi:predicted ATPase
LRINCILIENFRAIERLELTDLGQTIVVAGQNGAGKSCILDAIRLVKSIYGGYQANEYTMWFGEHLIPTDASPKEFMRLLRDKMRPLRLHVQFQLEDSEKEFLLSNLEELAVANAWKEIAPTRTKFTSGESIATRQRLHSEQVASRAHEDAEALRAEIQATTFNADVRLTPGQPFVVAPSLVLEYLFSNFKPEQLGVIDFHGSDRRYDREQIGNIDLNTQQREQHFQSHALYNQKNKYQNFKGQLAGQYVRELLAKEAGVASESGAALTETLRDLFSTFFPGKTFDGPVPTADGKLSFPVRTLDGKVHDIDELSSGEKEVLYGYLRLRNATPRNSVLLIDEPELHLNPRLVRGLSSFYHEHLSLPLNCQLWLITHSDTLLRDSVGRPGFSVFYLHSAQTLSLGTNQASQAQSVLADLIPLIEDLAGFNPQAKVILLEGGGETKFDAQMVTELFPVFAEAVNLVSAGSKLKINALRSGLEEIASSAELGAQFYSISDRDSDTEPSAPAQRAFLWDVYHIENYLVAPDYVFKAIRDLRVSREELTLGRVRSLLGEAAERTIGALVRHIMQKEASDLLLSKIELRANKTNNDVAADISRAASTVPAKVGEAVRLQLDLTSLQARATQLEQKFRGDLRSGEWEKSFQGRAVLRRFVDMARLTVGYDVFRYAIINAMQHDKYQPPGMKAVLDQIHSIRVQRDARA